MKFSLTKEHKSFFENNGLIEFSDLLSPLQIEDLNKEIKHILKGVASKDLFSKGHDLWRQSDRIRQILFRKDLARVAAELVFERPLRIGFDQLLIGGQSDIKELLLKRDFHLQGVACGMIIALDNAPTLPEEKVLSIFPEEAGHIAFLAPDVLFDCPEIEDLPDQKFLLVVFAKERSLYVLQENDIHTHSLKQFGYVFGDRLQEDFHPILFR